VSGFLVERWKAERNREVSQATVNRELNVIRGCFSRAVDWGRLERSPLAAVKAYRVDDVRIRVLNEEELATVLTQSPADLALMCRATLECLPRLSEVLGLRREHIGASWIEIRRKGGKVERVPVTPELRADLLRRAHRSGWVFGRGKHGRPPQQAAVSVAMTRLMRRLHLPGVSHHTMRHTGVTLMLEHGVNPRVIQRLAGWTSFRMLERYGHARDAEAARAVRTMRTILDSAQKPAHSLAAGNGEPSVSD
jgi:integrase